MINWTQSLRAGWIPGALAVAGVAAALALTVHTRLPVGLCAALGAAPFSVAAIAMACARRRAGIRDAGHSDRLLDRRDLPGLSLLLVLVCALLHPVLVGGQGLVPVDGISYYDPWRQVFGLGVLNPLLADQYLQLIPQQHFLHEQLMRGSFPLWNPHLACGVPFLASMQAAALFPINLLLAPFDPFVSSGPAALLKLWLAGFFTYLFLRCLGGSRAAATLAAIAFAFSGFLIIWLGHPHSNAAIWLPLLLFCIERAVVNAGRPRAWRFWAGFAAAYAAVWLGGHPPTAVHVSAVAALYFAFRWTATRADGASAARAAGFAVAVVGGLLVAAVQILPFLEYYSLSSASLASEALDRASTRLPPQALVHLLLPFLSGSPVLGFGHMAADLGIGREHNFHSYTGFFGVVTFVLAGLALLLRRDGTTRFFGLLAAGCLLIILGVPPLPSLIAALPVLGDMAHTRLLLVVGLCGAVLGGLGLDRLGRPGGERRRLVGFALLWLGVSVLLAFAWVELRPSLRAERAFDFVVRQYTIFAASFLAVTVVTQLTSHRRLAVGVCLVALSAEMLWFASGYNPASERSRYYPRTPGIELLEADDSVHRVIGMGSVLPPDTPMIYGIDDVRGRDFMNVRRYEQLILGEAGDFGFLGAISTLPPATLALNVKYLIAHHGDLSWAVFMERIHDGNMSIYRMSPYVERALIVRDFQVAEAPAVLERMRDGSFDPRSSLLLEARPADWDGPLGTPAAVDAVSITAYSPDRVEIEAALSEPGFLVLLDTWFPGWKVYVNGRPRPIERADYNFRAVRLPAGTWQVTFAYRPMSFALGATLSMMASAGLLALALGASPRSSPD
jgi:hypothetical protein